MEIKRFITTAKRGVIGNELHVFGVIQGLQMGICDQDIHKSFDCELFDTFCMFATETTQKHYDKFRSQVEIAYPGLCIFEEGIQK